MSKFTWRTLCCLILVIVADSTLSKANEPALPSNAIETLPMEKLTRGRGASMEVLLRGQLNYEEGIGSEQSNQAKVSVKLDYNGVDQVFDAEVKDNRFEVWLPINRVRWYVMYVQAKDSHGYLGRIEHITRPSFRSIAMKGIQFSMRKPDRSLLVSTRHEGNPIPNTTVRVNGPSGDYYATSNSEGVAKVEVFSSERLYGVCAWNKKGFLGGFRFDDDPKYNAEHDEHEVLLYNATQRKVKLQTKDGEPVSDVPILLHTATPDPEYNYFGIPDEVDAKTNADGIAFWPWYPKLEKLHEYAELSDANEKWTIEKKTATPEAFVVEVKPAADRKMITGVVQSTGISTAGINVELSTFQHEGEEAAHLYVHTDPSGRFEVEAIADTTYVIFVSDAVLASPHVSSVLYESQFDRVNSPTLELAEGIPVEVKFTSGKDATPYPVTNVNIDFQHPYTWQENGQQRGGTSGRRLVLDSDREGVLRFVSGAGKIDIRAWSSDWREEKTVVIEKGKPNQITFHRMPLEESEVKGTVLRVAGSETSHQNATVKVGGIDGKSREEQLTNTDDKGSFSLKTKAKEIAILVTSRDQGFAGTALTRDLSKPISIELHPTASYTGRLVDEDNFPIVGHPVEARVRLFLEQNFGAKTYSVKYPAVTDENGRFNIAGLPSNVPVMVSCDDLLDQDKSTFHLIEEVLLESKETRKGPVDVVRRTPTNETAKPLSQRFAKSQRNARLGGFRLLVVGGPMQEEATKTFVNEYVRNASRVEELGGYIQLVIDTSSPSEEALLFAKQNKWPSLQQNELFLIAYDKSGQELARRVLDITKSPSTTEAKHFIAEHAPKPENAQSKWDEAFDLAKRTDRKVWVRLSGNNCAPCFLLSGWIDEHRKILEKDFVILKVDSGYDSNATAISEAMQKGRLVGIPFHAMFDADGQTIIDSYGPLGNIGFMEGQEGTKHFKKMMEVSCSKISSREINSLLETLRN